ncbi:MAG: FAD-binding protein [Bacteroidales bacterium]|nr:FAD-binding protein [Bacteroidales bacterium]MBN2755580.1 FAD-binding protein [Bacteroidales bacterium]
MVAGIAGITATLELLDAGKSVILIDRYTKERFGGLAKESFGGMFFVNSPQQKAHK